MSAWESWLPRGRSLTFAGACARLVAALALFALPVGGLVFARAAWTGVAATAVAAAVCGLGGSLALAVVAWGRNSAPAQQGLTAVLAGFVFRMLLPLVVGLALSRQVPPLREAGVFGLIVVFYLFTLVVETWLSLRMARPANQPAGGGGFDAGGFGAAAGTEAGNVGGLSTADRAQGTS